MTTARLPRPASPAALHVLGALALELKGDAEVARTWLPQSSVGELAGLIARDLATFAADAALLEHGSLEHASLELVTVGAHYDPVEMLRPGWPLHRELDQLAARAPGETKSRVIAFGAHQGQLPGSLMPSADFAGGPLRLLPFVLVGEADTVAQVGAVFERDLLERGMAGADTALAAQGAFGLQVEHARYLTVHDLAAMMAMQYDHAGLAPLWPLLETALLQPDGDLWLDAPPEPLVHYTAGEARIALFSPQAWHARYASGAACDSDDGRATLQRRMHQFEARQRQYAAVFNAHAVPVTFVHCDDADGCREALS